MSCWGNKAPKYMPAIRAAALSTTRAPKAAIEFLKIKQPTAYDCFRALLPKAEDARISEQNAVITCSFPKFSIGISFLYMLHRQNVFRPEGFPHMSKILDQQLSTPVEKRAEGISMVLPFSLAAIDTAVLEQATWECLKNYKLLEKFAAAVTEQNGVRRGMKISREANSALITSVMATDFFYYLIDKISSNPSGVYQTGRKKTVSLELDYFIGKKLRRFVSGRDPIPSRIPMEDQQTPATP
jgi:hypothetical protein